MSAMLQKKLHVIGSVPTAPVRRRSELDAVERPGPMGRPMAVSQRTDDHGGLTELQKVPKSRTDQWWS